MQIRQVAHVLGVDEVRTVSAPTFETYVRHGSVRYRIISFDLQSVIGKILDLRRAGYEWNKNSHSWERN